MLPFDPGSMSLEVVLYKCEESIVTCCTAASASGSGRTKCKRKQTHTQAQTGETAATSDLAIVDIFDASVNRSDQSLCSNRHELLVSV